MTIEFKKLSDKAVMPIRTEQSGAGFDLTAARITTEVNERGQLLLVYHTDIEVTIPVGYEAYVRPSNTIPAKTLRMCGNNIISGGTSSEVVARYMTTTDVVPAVYEEGSCFAQLVINKIEDIELVEVIAPKDELSASNDDQSLPETKDMSINSETSITDSGEAANSLEQA